MEIAYLSVTCDTSDGTKNTSNTAIGRYVGHLLAPTPEIYNKKDKIIVVTNNDSDADYSKLNIKTYKAFSKSWKVGLEIYRFFRQHPVDIIHFQHEFFIYGGIIQQLFILLALIFLKKPQKVITAHHIMDIGKVDKKMIAENNYSFPVPVVKLGLILSYSLMFLAANKVLVHEDDQKDILIGNFKAFRNLNTKIEVVAHGIATKETISKEQARQELKLKAKFYIIFFGYVAKHKGVDLLLDAVKILQDKGRDISVIVAGGAHPKLHPQKEYSDYYEGLKAKCAKLKDSNWFGFATDEELKVIFSASDLAVFPYTTRNATSGSVTDSISYNVPFIVSEKFGEIREFNGLFFNLNSEALANKIIEAFDNIENIKAKIFELRSSHSWLNIAQKLEGIYTLLYTKTEKTPKQYPTYYPKQYQDLIIEKQYE